MKKLVLGLFIIINILNAASVIDVRKKEMTPLIKCDSNAMCENRKAIDIRSSFYDPTITAIICKNESDCNGITSGEARMKGLYPIVMCKPTQECGSISFQKAIMYGIKPVVPCTVNGECDGVDTMKVRMNQMTPVVFCSATGECV
jgi:hypothetical protein